jgi:hypothetical protein
MPPALRLLSADREAIRSDRMNCTRPRDPMRGRQDRVFTTEVQYSVHHRDPTLLQAIACAQDVLVHAALEFHHIDRPLGATCGQ